LSRQVLSPQASPESAELAPWVRFLRAHAALTRELNARLIAEHGLTLNDYEVLLRLAHAPDRQLRRVDLASLVLLTASGITRLLEGLERAGYVERGECPSDARVSYAVLTRAGLAKLREASETHLEDVHALFLERFSRKELDTLAELLGRVGGTEDGSCGVD
jgi:DNA-binding MarR family transcriptional regulator